MAKALRMVSGDISRLRISTFSFPRAALCAVSRATQTVVTFKPPPVDMGAAPIIIRISVSMSVPVVSVPISATQNPAVRGVTAPRNALASCPLNGQSGERIVHFQQIVEKCTAGKQYQRADHHDVRVDIDNSGGMDIMLLLSDYDLECIDKQMS